MASSKPKQGASWAPLKITVSRGGSFLRTGDVASRLGGAKIGRLLPAAYNGVFLRLLRR